jgi:hypothetical protein
MAQVVPSEFNITRETISRVPVLKGASNYTEWALAL